MTHKTQITMNSGRQVPNSLWGRATALLGLLYQTGALPDCHCFGKAGGDEDESILYIGVNSGSSGEPAGRTDAEVTMFIWQMVESYRRHNYVFAHCEGEDDEPASAEAATLEAAGKLLRTPSGAFWIEHATMGHQHLPYLCHAPIETNGRICVDEGCEVDDWFLREESGDEGKDAREAWAKLNPPAPVVHQLAVHMGNVTGDAAQLVDGLCNMDRRYGWNEVEFGLCITPLDAPDRLNTGRMVDALGVQFQQQDYRA